MSRGIGALRKALQNAWGALLELDNNIIGLVIAVAAIYDWVILYDGIEDLKIYFSQGIYALSSLSAVSTLFSASI